MPVVTQATAFVIKTKRRPAIPLPGGDKRKRPLNLGRVERCASCRSINNASALLQINTEEREKSALEHNALKPIISSPLFSLFPFTLGFEVTKIIKLLTRCMIFKHPWHAPCLFWCVPHLFVSLGAICCCLAWSNCLAGKIFMSCHQQMRRVSLPTTHLSLRVLRTGCERGAVCGDYIYLMKREVRALGGDWLQPPESIDTYAPHRALSCSLTPTWNQLTRCRSWKGKLDARWACNCENVSHAGQK